MYKLGRIQFLLAFILVIVVLGLFVSLLWKLKVTNIASLTVFALILVSLIVMFLCCFRLNDINPRLRPLAVLPVLALFTNFLFLAYFDLGHSKYYLKFIAPIIEIACLVLVFTISIFPGDSSRKINNK